MTRDILHSWRKFSHKSRATTRPLRVPGPQGAIWFAHAFWSVANGRVQRAEVGNAILLESVRYSVIESSVKGETGCESLRIRGT